MIELCIMRENKLVDLQEDEHAEMEFTKQNSKMQER